MEKFALSEFIYLYSKVYLARQVQCVLGEENWNSKDFDQKYWEYLRIYLFLRKEHQAGKLTKEHLEEGLRMRSRTRINESQTRLRNNLVRKLRQEFHIDDETYDRIKTELNAYCPEEDFNMDLIPKMREIEWELMNNEGKFKNA